MQRERMAMTYTSTANRRSVRCVHEPNSSVDISVSASGRRRASDPNLFGRPSEAGVSCDEGAGPGARAASGRRPRRPLGRRVRLVREVRVVRVVRVERRRVLRRIAQELRNRRSDEIQLFASPLHFSSDEEEGASPPHAPSIGEDAVGDTVPNADEEALPRRRRYPISGTAPDAGGRHHRGMGRRTTPRIDSWESTDAIEPDETETEGPGTLDGEEPMLISSEDEEDTGEERRSSTSPVNPDDEETMPWPPETPEPEVIVISDEEEEEEQRDDGGEAQGQGERPQIPPPTVTATYARAFADGRWRHQRQRSPTPPAVRSPPPPPPEWIPPFLRQASCPEVGPRPTRPTLQRQSSAPEGEAGWQELPPPAWPPGITAMADAQPGPSRRTSRIVWQEGHRYRVKTSMRGPRVFRKV
ncbi:GH23612 [Drosophila grimshawi]|uniref:GH23612 n=1 Tax=Drosophila grimshawi TaxID=7222 RepID=B4K080_DROGR|nr:GH23612 [Drosophila grimshawi]